ncbi:FixH family protein [Burkholderiaceae bacterium DAT-1]|nr:FixH family protein [Burkholderiaceae bacterium DAT-1]
MTTAVTQEKVLWYRVPFVWLLLVLLATAVIASIMLMWVAAKTNDGVITDDYYKQGLAIEEDFHRDDMALKLGMNIQLMVGDDSRQIHAIITAGKDQPESLKIKFSHPTAAGRDQIITLKPDSSGMYAGTLEHGLQPIRWLIDIEAPKGWRLYDQSKLGSGSVTILRPHQQNHPIDE